MNVVDKISSTLKPIKVMLIALLFGVVLTLGIIYINTHGDKDEFAEIRNLPRSEKKNKENIETYSNLIDIYDFNKQSVGIDVSEWQGAINYEKVKSSGVEFVIIRCGLRLTDEIHEDNYFRDNIENALKAGLRVGVYFFSTASNEIEALEEAEWVVNILEDYDITYPVVYDMENIGNFSTYNLSLEQINKDAKIFLDYVSNNGYVGMLYSNGNDLFKHWDLELLKAYPIWYAYYGTNPEYDGNYIMWQYSDEGHIKGIYANVDLNIAYFSYIGDK